MSDEVAAISDKDFLRRVRGQAKVAEQFADAGGEVKFSMNLTTAKRLLALAEAGMPKTEVAVPDIIDITPTEQNDVPAMVAEADEAKAHAEGRL